MNSSAQFTQLVIEEAWRKINKQKRLLTQLKEDHKEYLLRKEQQEKEWKKQEQEWNKKILEWNIQEYGFWIIEDPFGNYLKFANGSCKLFEVIKKKESG